MNTRAREGYSIHWCKAKPTEPGVYDVRVMGPRGPYQTQFGVILSEGHLEAGGYVHHSDALEFRRTTNMRYTPPTQMTLEHGERPVVGVVAYPPGQHPKGTPIKAEHFAVELKTDVGESGWYGFEEAYIDSTLRMVVGPVNPRFESAMRWEVVG